MSEVTKAATAKAAPKNTNGPKLDPKKSYTVDDVAKMRAQMRGIDVSRAAKDVRGKLRANFAEVVKADPNVAKVKTAANDGNRWPAFNAKVAAIALRARGA